MSLPPQPSAFFLESARGRHLAVLHSPPAGLPPRIALLHVHAFAEEMNKARRMVSLQSRALARDGHAVLLLDLTGCGDASGDFGDATWEGWLADVVMGSQWLRDHVPAPLWLWGLRAGGLLAAAAWDRISPAASGLLLWQPPASGQALLSQFLRLKAAGSMADGQAKATLDGLRARLAAGQPVEIGGYGLAAALAQGLGNASLAPPRQPAQLCLLETSPRAEPTLSPGTERLLTNWRSAGWQAEARAVQGPSFWQTTEIEDAPGLLAATTAMMAMTPGTAA